MSQANPESQPAAQPEGANLNLSAGGDASVGGSVVGRDMVTVNNTVTVALSGDLLAQLEQIKALSTELTKAATQREAAPQPPAVKAPEALKSVDTALQLLQQAGPAGVQELHSGGLQISRIELLLKKAILLEAEADEILFDAYLQAGNQANEAGEQALPEGYDDAPRLAKLREAEKILREANQLDPANTEVLARLALVVITITPDNPAESLKLLNRVQQLISFPKDSAEKFRLGQAKYFLAFNRTPPDEANLHEARVLFAELGRLEWVGYVDADLAKLGGSSAGGGAAAFDPRGPWVIGVDDRAKTVIGVELLEDGTCQGVQETAAQSKKGASTPLTGEWAYDGEQHILAIQGQLETGKPLTLTIQLQSEDEQGIHAVDEKGRAYLLTRPQQ